MNELPMILAFLGAIAMSLSYPALWLWLRTHPLDGSRGVNDSDSCERNDARASSVPRRTIGLDDRGQLLEWWFAKVREVGPHPKGGWRSRIVEGFGKPRGIGEKPCRRLIDGLLNDRYIEKVQRGAFGWDYVLVEPEPTYLPLGGAPYGTPLKFRSSPN